MKRKEPIIAFEPELQRGWRNAARLRDLHPRIGVEDVVNLVNAAWPPTVFMRENPKTTDIVIRIPGSSRQLSNAHRKIYFENFVPLKRVFEDVIVSKAPAKGENTLRRKLATEAYRAYQMTWLRLFRVQFLDQVYPARNPPKWFLDMENAFKSRRPAGRPKRLNDNRLRNRFDLFFDYAERLHRMIADYLSSKPAEALVDGGDVIRAFWRQILKIPRGISILGGEAFNAIPYGKQNEPAALEAPKTWKPRQLAVALLAFETDAAYQTIERKFPLHEKPKRSSSRK